MRGAGYYVKRLLSNFMYGYNKENCWWYDNRSRHYLNVEEDIKFQCHSCVIVLFRTLSFH